MNFHLLILLAICTLSWGSTSTRDPLQALNHINGLKFTPESLHSDFYSLSVLYSLIDENINSPEIHRELLDIFNISINKFYFQMKKLYEENPTILIVGVVNSDPFPMGFFFYREEYAENTRYFEARSGKLVQDDTPDVAFDYVNSYIWREFQNTVSSADRWQDRVLKAEAHIRILKSIKVTYYPKELVYIIENGIPTLWSMSGVIKRLKVMVEKFKLHEGKIHNLDFFKAFYHIVGLKFTPKSLRSDFDSLCKFYPLFDAKLDEHEIYTQLRYTFIKSCSKCYSQIKKLYEENPKKFILEVAESDPLLMGFFFHREERPGNTRYFQELYRKVIFGSELLCVSFSYVNSFIWREFKKPISVLDPWEDRILSANAHIGILKRVQAIYPFDQVTLLEDGIPTFGSMRTVIERLEFIIEEFKLYEGKIDTWDLVKVCGKIQSLIHKFKGVFDVKEAGPYLDLFRLLANHFMITPNEEDILITIQPEILYLCIISFNNRDDSALFKHFGKSVWDLKTAAFESIPEKSLSQILTVTVLSEQDHWLNKVYSRFEYLKKSLSKKRSDVEN
jgi:hypothetical protein